MAKAWGTKGEQKEPRDEVGAVISGAARILPGRPQPVRRMGAFLNVVLWVDPVHKAAAKTGFFHPHLLCRENQTFSTRVLSRDSGWDPVTAIHCAGMGFFAAAERSNCRVLSRALALHNRSETRRHLVFAVNGHGVIILLQGE